MIYAMSVGNWISVVGFSICLLYCLFLIVWSCIKKHKVKKAIKEASEKVKVKKSEKLNSENKQD